MTYRSESELQSEIITTLERIGIWVVRAGRNRRRGKRGVSNSGEDGYPDLDLPELGYIEVKLPGRKLDPEQVKWHAKAKSKGINVGTAWSVEDAVKLAKAWELLESR